MVLNINDNDYELNFGIRFLNQLNKLYEDKTSPVKIERGLVTLVANLSMMSPVALLDGIMASTYKQKPILTEDKVEEWLEEQDINEMCESFLEQLKTSPMTKGMMAKLVDEDSLY